MYNKLVIFSLRSTCRQTSSRNFRCIIIKEKEKSLKKDLQEFLVKKISSFLSTVKNKFWNTLVTWNRVSENLC